MNPRPISTLKRDNSQNYLDKVGFKWRLQMQETMNNPPYLYKKEFNKQKILLQQVARSNNDTSRFNECFTMIREFNKS